jgi:exopolyphosphatase/guanosine-5'-triphosphate,3'-diphosphate pyrophosphatase
MIPAKHLIAVDLGSNSFHLVIAIEQAGCIKIIHSQKQKIFLARGLDANNVLSQEAIDIAIDCLAQFKKSFATFEKASVRVVATQTLRCALNGEAFIKAARLVFPYPIEVISGTNEAELIFQGVVHTEPVSGKALVIDIGGASTELVIGENFKPNLAHSIPLGSSLLANQFFSEGHVSTQLFDEAQAFARKQLLPIADHFRLLSWRTAFGTSGSIKAITAIIKELYQEDTITYRRLKQLKQQLIAWQHCDNFSLKNIDEHRRPLLAPALAILISCFEMLCIPNMSYCSAALREGVLYGLSSSRPSTNIQQRTIDHLCHLHVCNPSFNKQLIEQLEYCNHLLTQHQQALDNDAMDLLRWAAHLHEIGININRKKRQQHSQYIVENSDMTGFCKQQQHTLSLLVGLHRGKIDLTEISAMSNASMVIKLIQLLRVAIILTKEQLVLAALADLSWQGSQLTLHLKPNIAGSDHLISLLEKEQQQTPMMPLSVAIKNH